MNTYPEGQHTVHDSANFQSLRAVRLGRDVVLGKFINLYDCDIGAQTKIGAFVEIQSGVKVGERCKISSHSFLCTGVEIEDEVFIGHGVMFCNDKYPKATTMEGELAGPDDWLCTPTKVCRGASIGSGAVILPGVTIGEKAQVGAGAVVSKSVVPHDIVMGPPAIPAEYAYGVIARHSQ